MSAILTAVERLRLCTRADPDPHTVLVRRGSPGPGSLPGLIIPSRTFLTQELKRF